MNGVRFIPDRWSPRLEHIDGPYFFIDDSTLAIFRADPKRYAIHRDY